MHRHNLSFLASLTVACIAPRAASIYTDIAKMQNAKNAFAYIAIQSGKLTKSRENQEMRHETYEYETLSPRKQKRLLLDVRILGIACALDAYAEALRVPYNALMPSDRRALRRLLGYYDIEDIPPEGEQPMHPIWQAFWEGVAEVPVPKY